MKAKRNLWKRVSIVLVFSILTTLGFLISCEKENIQPLNNDSMRLAQADEDDAVRDINQSYNLCGEVQRKSLLLDNGKQVGFVFVYNDTKYFYVQVVAMRGLYFKNAFLFTGTREELPLTKGNLDYKAFNHIKESPGLVKTIRFKIPLEETHTDFVSSLMVQTNFGDVQSDLHKAWADGRTYGETQFGKVFSYSKNFCEIDNIADFPDKNQD